jgi:hypothetical protein
MSTEELSDVLGSLHADKARVLRTQLSGIAVEITERYRIANVLTTALNDEALEIGSTLLNLVKQECADAYLRERIALSEQRRTLTKELRSEQRESWRDVQELRREQRTIEQELVEAGQRRQRLEDLTLDAPRPV